MSAENEVVVRRYYEDMCNGRQNDLADELFADDHEYHDPAIPGADGPEPMVKMVGVFQDGIEGQWDVHDLFARRRPGERPLDAEGRAHGRDHGDPAHRLRHRGGGAVRPPHRGRQDRRDVDGVGLPGLPAAARRPARRPPRRTSGTACRRRSGEPRYLEFDPGDLDEVVATMDALAAAHKGWVNFEPVRRTSTTCPRRAASSASSRAGAPTSPSPRGRRPPPPAGDGASRP